MKSFKDKMYNHEVTPPSQSWQIISTALDNESIKKLYPKPGKKIMYVRLAAASVIVIVISALMWFSTLDTKSKEIIANQSSLQVTNSRDKEDVNGTGINDKITVPGTNDADNNPAGKTVNATRNELSGLRHDATPKKYITISGPEGQPVKISAKAASLIVSSDDQYPPNTIWDVKVKKWKDIMKANTLAPTTANFLDIVELTHALKIQNP